MSGNLDGYDANDYDPQQSFEAIPEGDYLAIITDSEFKATSAGTGEYLELTFQIIEGERNGRNVWARLNLKNPSVKATEIASSELSSICRSVGIMRPKDSSELHDKPLIIKVKCETRKDTGAIRNVIKGYDDKGGPVQSEPVKTEYKKETAPWKK